MRNSSLLKWTQNVSNKSGKENKNWIHPPETLQKGHIAYLVKFMGSVEVEQPKGFNVVREAIRKLRFNQQIRKSSEGTKLPKVELTISIDGITIQDPKTKTIMHQYPLYRISYCADDKVERQFISFIVKEQDSEQHTCFVFLSDKLSEEITVTIGQAFELAYKSSANKPNKLSFRARQLDVSKPMPIYMSEDLSDLAETTEIKRAVPQMPTGMEKDEECEHHLQRAIFSGTVIPTPEVTQLEDLQMYRRTYPAGSHMPKQLVRMHPFALEPEHPDYDADSEDEAWVAAQGKALGVDVDQFEAIIDRLDKNSNFSVITLPESKALLKEGDAVVTAVYDYWLSKRLRLQHSLIPAVKTEAGSGPANDPYIAFRRRKDKMQTRKNRKNDETSYEKMLKLKKDLSYAHSLFQMVQRRESIKLQLVRLHMELYQKRYEAKDFSGSLLNEVKSWKRTSAMGGAANALYNSTSLASAAQSYAWTPKPKELLKRASSSSQALRQTSYYLQDDSSGSPKKERRHYKKRKRQRLANGGYEGGAPLSSDDERSEGSPLTASSSGTDENPFSFKRQRNCSYLAPVDDRQPWDYDVDEAFGDERRRFYAAYVSIPRLRSVGFARRRLGRGGRLLLDRAGVSLDDVWSTLDYTIKESGGGEAPLPELAKYKPRSPCTSGSESDDDDDAPFYESDASTGSSPPKPLIEVENLVYGSPAGADRICLEVELNAPLKHEATYALLDRIATHIENCNRELVANAAASGRWSGGASGETSGSILERWTKSHKNGADASARSAETAAEGRLWRRPPPRPDFSLEDGETIGCSTFRTVTGEYFENVFGGGKNGSCGGHGVEYTLQEKGNHNASAPTSLSQLLNDCDSLGFR